MIINKSLKTNSQKGREKPQNRMCQEAKKHYWQIRMTRYTSSVSENVGIEQSAPI